jgi:hypothetical protein
MLSSDLSQEYIGCFLPVKSGLAAQKSVLSSDNQVHYTEQYKLDQLPKFAIMFTHVSIYVWEGSHEQKNDRGVPR